MVKKFILSFSFLFWYNCFGQIELYEIQAVVLDLEHHQPILGVFVIDSLGFGTTITDEDGHFNITVVDSSSLVLSHISYQKKSISTQDLIFHKLDTIFLKTSIEELDEIVLQNGDYQKFKQDFLALERDSFEINIQIPGVKQYKGPINLKPGGDGESGSLILGAVSNLINPNKRKKNRVKRWMKKIKKRREK